MSPSEKKAAKGITPATTRLRNLETELDWTRFALALEEKLADLVETEAILRELSDRLKQRLLYDYLEISRSSESAEEAEPANWVRNDTGYGGKLLTLILTPDFLRGLRWRRNPVVVSQDEPGKFVENPDLLQVMNLQAGILVPLCQGSYTQGVLKIFFQRPVDFNPELRRWLVACAEILQRSLLRAHHHQKIQRMATVDGLTGLYNHRYFTEQLQKEFARARRYRNWLSLIIIDIDYFKQYNDRNGHLAGDRALKKVAHAIRHNVREMDLVARYGGEEFALILPEISGENGMIVAEKIRHEVEIQRFRNESEQPNGNLTISLGVAQNSPHLKSPREMFNLADAALYQAKRQGRNRCVFAK